MMMKEEAIGLRFFRIIYPSLYFKMSIPPVFVNGKKEKEREMVTLVGQNGKIWHIDLYVKENSKLFMGGDGWRRFVAANALQIGYMLVFKYTGNLVFSFRAFDHSNCETASSSTSLPAYQKCLTKKTSKQIHYVYENDRDSNQEPGSTPNSSKKRKVHRKPSKTSTPKVTTCTKAGGWFEIIIKPSHLMLAPVCIPVRFKESIGLAAENANVNLRDLTGHAWPIKIYYRKQSTSHYMTGFHKFANANQLKIRDRCIIESDSNQEPGSTPNSSKKRKVHRKPSKTSTPKFTTCTKAGGWFEIIIKPSHLKLSPVCIPVRFKESIGLAAENANVNLRDLTGHAWPIKIYYRKQSTSHYMTGFHKFANANQLKIGDRCIIESVSPEEPKVFQVKIDRSTHGTIGN